MPDFTPVSRLNHRHDGWTPERHRAVIEVLAATGGVSRAAAMVNLAQANCYTLRRAPGAEEFRRVWEAALDFGVQRLKDIAVERDGDLARTLFNLKCVELDAEACAAIGRCCSTVLHADMRQSP